MSRRRSDALTGELALRAAIPDFLPGSMDLRRVVAQLVSACLKEADGSRYAVASRMSELADVETSKALLDSYTAESREECNAPLWKAPLIEIATNTRHLAEWHVAVLGGRALWGDDILDADIGRREREVTRLRDEIALLKAHRKAAR